MINSFSTRLSGYILSITVVLFVLSFSIYFRYSGDLLLQGALARQDAEVERIVEHVDTILSDVEMSVESAVFVVNRLMAQGGDFADIEHNFIHYNDAIYGMAVAFEPYKRDSSRRYFMQYTMRDGSNHYSTSIVGDEQEYDYFSMEWYLKPQSNGEGYWCEPYFDVGAGDVPMTTYSVPLYDYAGEFVGVVTADVSLELILETISNYTPYPNSTSYILNNSGYYIATKDEATALNRRGDLVDPELGKAPINEIGRDMIAQKRGHREVVIEGDSRYVFYAPIERTGWSVGTASLNSDIFSEIDRVNSNFWIVISCGLLLIFTLTILVIKRATRPLVLFAKSADEISKGDFDVVMPEIQNRDEMYRLREAFINMQGSLKSYIEELQATTAARERIDSELSIASQIQMGMLPQSSSLCHHLSDVDLFATLLPAKEVSGDLYDFFADGDTLYFTIGDASGKGVPASLLMAVTSSLFRSMAQHLKDPAKILESMNNSISEKNEANMFITLFVGALNIKSGELHYSSAGHNAPILIRGGEASFIDVAPNIALGVISNMAFVSHKMSITSEDMLFLYSDGLTEAESCTQELYSDERLLARLTNLGAEVAAKEVLDGVMESVRDFVEGNEQSDDLTMLVVRLKS